MKITLVPALLCLLSVTCPTQQKAVPAPEVATAEVCVADDAFVLDVGEHEVGQLIDRVAAFLDFNILYEAQELANAGKIRVTRRTEVDADGCWVLFGSLLHHKGFAILPLDATQGFHQVIAMNGPRRGDVTSSALFVPFAEVEAYAELKATPIQTSVPLKNINATIATNALRPFFAAVGGPNSGLTFGNVGNNSQLLVQGFGHQVAAACRWLQRVDVGETVESRIQVVRLEHAVAQDMVSRIEAAFGARTQQVQMQAQMGGIVSPEVPLRAVADASLNSVLLVGTREQIDDALQLIARLDLPSATPRKGIEDLERRLHALTERVEKLERALRAAK